MTTPLNEEAFDLACKELFLTITAHKSAADVLGFDWKSLKASTRQPWETATRKVLATYLEEDGMEEANARMAKILTDTANALKGEPEPLVTHSWHDLAEVAQLAVAQPELLATSKPKPNLELAQAWDEGHKAGWDDRNEDEKIGYYGNYNADTPNPYRNPNG